jgi:peptidyl-prolyl cis-trans isomerase B (cyclophilin B)
MSSSLVSFGDRLRRSANCLQVRATKLACPRSSPRSCSMSETKTLTISRKSSNSTMAGGAVEGGEDRARSDAGKPVERRTAPPLPAVGCSNTGTGAGGPGYKIDCELDGENQHHDRGALSMAHAGRNTGGSQFFICHNRKNTAHLDRNHTVFGRVVEGLDVIDDIRAGDAITKVEIIEE